MKPARPNVEQVLRGLKDFQLASVEYVFQRMYLDEPLQHRFLVADEVGLGKTLVARGLVAKVVDHLWDKVERIDVVYICSNGDIARQNIARLRIPGASEFALASRVTMLPVHIHDLRHSQLNFVSLTPGTSLDPKSSLGMGRERALLYLLLQECWSLSGPGSLHVFQGNKGADRFRRQVRDFESIHTIDPHLKQRFIGQVQGRKDLHDRCQDLSRRFGPARRKLPPEDALDRRRFIGELRGLLAATCIEELEPDLIILDEFQRFKDLLDGESEAAALARSLFEWSRGADRARVLMLSATPYKMLTLQHERETDDHFADFLRTIRFLAPPGDGAEGMDALFRRYRSELYQMGDGRNAALDATKAELEHRLRSVMVRTERLAITSDRAGMLSDATLGGLSLTAGDIAGYRALHSIAQALDQADPLELWKSAPFLLSFMEDYQLKQRLRDHQGHAPSARVIADVLRAATGLSLSTHDVEGYNAIDPGNARLRWLLADTVERGAWQLLWVPPSLPYYRPSGAWADEALSGFTKRLVFSSWRVVPRMIGAMVSYAAERAAVLALPGERPTWSSLRERLRGPLRFAVREGQLAGMAVLGVMYPSLALATLGDPLAWAGAEPADLDNVRAAVRERIAASVAPLGKTGADGPPDARWYWAAPILLDLAEDDEAVRAFWTDSQLAATWTGETKPGEDDTAFEQHLDQARDLIAGKIGLGPQPDDLAAVLTDLALGGPGVAAARALGRVSRYRALADRVIVRRQAARVGWSFRNLFNLSESVAVLRGINPEEPYWRRVVEYCVAGNLQAVLDEYAHMLFEIKGLDGLPARHVMAEVGDALQAAIGLRTSNPRFDEVTAAADGYQIKSPQPRLRARFALRFGEERGDGDDKQAMRADQVRDAFNSPFWPFVLATTSVGQEGLDFHPYCHAVVHWNLPSNPVDLEQREGRVHRYKGHAVRKTIAGGYRGCLEGTSGPDPWATLFERAVRERKAESELVPFWVHGDPGGCRIERHVPSFPLSREIVQFDRLRRSLALYRMVFGQPRQDDLISYLLERMPEEQVRERLGSVRIDLQPPPVSRRLAQGDVPPLRPDTVQTPPTGSVARAIIHALDGYPIVLSEYGAASRHHSAAQALGSIAEQLDMLGLPRAHERVCWETVYRDGRHWLEVPIVWLSDQRKRVRKHDDVTIELLLDIDRDGIHVALMSDWGFHAGFVPRPVGRRYADARRVTLRPILASLEQAGFEATVGSEYVPAGDFEDAWGVVLASRFYGRFDLVEDGPLVAGIRTLLSAYEETYKQGLAHPTAAERKHLD